MINLLRAKSLDNYHCRNKIVRKIILESISGINVFNENYFKMMKTGFIVMFCNKKTKVIKKRFCTAMILFCLLLIATEDIYIYIYA